MQLGQAGKLMPNDLQGGTFTLSNIGTVGGTYAAPLIVAPEARRAAPLLGASRAPSLTRRAAQVIIGAMGKFQVVPRFVGARVGGDNAGLPVRPVTILNISWSADHRVLEGVEVASFSNTFKQVLENPALFAFYGK
jgi:2-oxoisovalerate dehydrogenase E2 component (dihydrolipoyl transacylase)